MTAFPGVRQLNHSVTGAPLLTYLILVLLMLRAATSLSRARPRPLNTRHFSGSSIRRHVPRYPDEQQGDKPAGSAGSGSKDTDAHNEGPVILGAPPPTFSSSNLSSATLEQLAEEALSSRSRPPITSKPPQSVESEPSSSELASSTPPSESSTSPSSEKEATIDSLKPDATTSTSEPPSPSSTPQPLPTYNLEEVKQRIKHWTEKGAIAIRNRADEFTAQAKVHFSQLGQHLNKATGYEEIEALKKDVVAQEQRIHDSRIAARRAKALYEEAVIQRQTSQREVNDLLSRKSTWTDSDVSRFTTLVRQDHLYEQQEQAAKARVAETEDAVEREFSQLMRLILARYHEEQVWSDKIRSASTYGQMAALGLNLLVFLLAIVLVEPWKRKRLAQTFERKVGELSEDYAKMMEVQMRNVEEKLKGHEVLLVKMAQELAERPEFSAPVPTMNIPAGAEEKASEDVKIKVKVQTKEKTVRIGLPGVATVPVSTRTLELAAVGTGTFILGVVGSLLMSR
ncbi:hypothetical protein NMY22_g12162 [Coprinellus aureogranulatus]|nr:hypothetical protein NMY22_g12162 [Coprinellus aureogranulatus]